MKFLWSKKAIAAVTIVMLLIVAAAIVLVLNHHQDKGKYTYINGTVTAYDVSPTATDGSIIFSINNTPIDIGGGLRVGGDQPAGYVYSPIKVGDKVEAKVAHPEPGYYSVFDCSACYIKKR